ncbi:gamma-glutamyltransferase [Lacisediminimonas profundi]|uniref:gamma-glutamyltransferase n=1 Tax=Lacisediminimonas profundi TaxID=2603856 RepID=UPI00124B7BBB|nr:gamma-glutamyltransferase [Lacisediminimonas profundi]
MLRRLGAVVLSCLSLLAVSGCALAPVAPEAGAPEAASGWTAKPGWPARKFIAVAAHPLATRAGYEILGEGGSAVDAAIAIQMVLTLVEPQSSGIGGGAFLLHANAREVQAWDGRESAPRRATQGLFLQSDGRPMGFAEATVGGRSVGTPGVLRMLEQAHREHGRVPWARLFLPAIRLAEQGFPVSARLAALLKRDRGLREDSEAGSYFFGPDGQARPAGYLLKNPALARSLQRIAGEGADAFYRGQIAAAMVAKVASHPRNPGLLREDDLMSYRALKREPLCGEYRQWRVCGMPPPSSGGIAILQMLGMLETTAIARLGPISGQPQQQAVHLFAEAGRLAFADRARYVADTDFVPLPGGSPVALLDKAYLARRSSMIGDTSLGTAAAGRPLAAPVAMGQDQSPGLPSTSHISVVDADGNAVTMTTSIERAFGSRLMVNGFLLNNQLTDFSFLPADRDGPIANRVEPGKRPRSAMSPTLVFDRSTGELVLAIGSPGGPAIINYVAKALVGVLDWGLDVQQAIDLPNFGSRNGPTELEAGRFPPGFADSLRARGHAVVSIEQTSGLHGIQRMKRGRGEQWFAGADPRREGVAMGE